MDRAEIKRAEVSYVIRPCETLAELSACVRIQKAIWGYAEHELYPLRLFVTLSKIGGCVLGAFAPDNQLVAFAALMPAWHGEQRYYHSLSLGVLKGHENQGLGRALKLEQRRRALQAGIDCIEWTFDPLRAKNAYLNIVRLGAIARRYMPDYYGHVDSQLQKGLPSDRLIAEWWIKAPRVERALEGEPARNTRRSPVEEVEIPKDLSALVEQNAEAARAIQSAVRERLQNLFARGLAITGFILDGSAARYQLDAYEN